MTGNVATPFLLAKVNELTGGASLAASILLRPSFSCSYVHIYIFKYHFNSVRGSFVRKEGSSLWFLTKLFLNHATDIALVKNNALVGAKIALSLANLRSKDTSELLITLYVLPLLLQL